MLGLSQKAYINPILKMINMEGYSLDDAPTVKGDKFSKSYVRTIILK